MVLIKKLLVLIVPMKKTSANVKITNAINANKKSTDGNNAITNSTITIRKKSSIIIKLKRPHVLY